MNRLVRVWPLGIRAQLMLWYSLVFACLMGIFAVLFYLRFQTTLAESADTALQLQAQQVAGDITEKQGTIILHDATADLPGFDPTDQKRHVPPSDVNLGVLVRIVNGQGVPFQTTPAFRSIVVPPQSIMQPLHGRPWQGTTTTTDGQLVRLYSRALTQEGRIFGIVQVATSLTEVETSLHEMVLNVLLIAPLILLLGALGSFWLAARALQPIQRLTQTALIIKGGDLRQRVPLPRAHDELWHLAGTLNEMIASVEHAFQRQRRFVADASHELRTPVTVIRSKAKLALLQVFTPEEYAALFQAIHDEAERLGRLMSDLLALARADEGQVHLEKEAVRVDLLIEAVVAAMDVIAAQHQVTVEVTATEPVRVRGDEARLMQVVMNLLENAIYYNDVGGQVFVSVQANHDQMVLVVRDTGIGIAEEHLPSVFDRFYRVDPARTQREGGNNGLGLSIVNWIVKAHRGSIRVESQVGAGSTFTVVLPSARTEQSAPLLKTLSNQNTTGAVSLTTPPSLGQRHSDEIGKVRCNQQRAHHTGNPSIPDKSQQHQVNDNHDR